MWNGRLFCLSFSARRFPHPHHPFRIRWQRYKSEESRGEDSLRSNQGFFGNGRTSQKHRNAWARRWARRYKTMVVVCFQVFPAFILLSGRVLLTLPIKFKEEPCAEGRTGPFGSLSSWVCNPFRNISRAYVYIWYQWRDMGHYPYGLLGLLLCFINLISKTDKSTYEVCRAQRFEPLRH